MKVIKKVDILSIAKLAGFLVGGVYLVAGVVVSLVVFILGVPAIKTLDFLGLGSALLATLLVAILMGALSFIIGAIMGWLFNVGAKLIGGIHFELGEAEDGLIREVIKPRKIEKNSSLNPQEEINHLIKGAGFDGRQGVKSEERETFTSDNNPHFLSS